MSGKVRGKVSGNVSSQTTSINEKILKQCHLLYADPDNGMKITVVFISAIYYTLNLC